MFRAKTQIWMGVALSILVISLLVFEEINRGHIEWRNQLLAFAAGPFVALRGYFRLLKQRNAPPKKISESPKIGPLDL